ncbi:MAG: hypothetical protein KDC38_07075 [Planctomycetes bacterium]|nr:hypothetical protein [Planctomycetota bacterium]
MVGIFSRSRPRRLGGCGLRRARRAAPLALGLALTLIGGATSAASAQSFEDIRASLREALRDVHFAKSLTGLVLLSDEIELSSARYTIDDDSHTRLSAFTFPFHSSAPAFGASPRLHIEGVLGYARATQRAVDVYAGALPGLETRIETDWTSYSGLAGLGLEFELFDGVTFTPIGNIGLGYLENDADYSGPGAALSKALFEGIAFGWDAWVLSGGIASRIDVERELSESIRWTLVGRYDLRWTETFQEDDAAQDFQSRSQLLTLRGDLLGPTPWTPFGGALGWRITTAVRWFLEQTLFDVDSFAELGGALELDTTDIVPYTHELSVYASIIYGDDVWGWTAGFRASF